MFPTGTIVTIITTDRLREAEIARLARRGAHEQPPKRRGARRLRAATRLALSALR
ncbi:MAG: hypothetical protein ACXWWL_06240 [Candidatus Limnocylindria bacterium]